MALRLAIIATVAIAIATSTTHADGKDPRKIALIIGNAKYSAAIGALDNPHNDISVLGDALQSIGFEVHTLKDGGYRKLRLAIGRHVRRVRRAGKGAIGLFYYSGHGAQDAETNQNFLIPTDVAEPSTDMWDASINLKLDVVKRLREEAGNASHFVVFDACRNTLRVNVPGTKSLVQTKGFQGRR